MLCCTIHLTGDRFPVDTADGEGVIENEAGNAKGSTTACLQRATSYVDQLYILALESCTKTRPISDCDSCTLLHRTRDAEDETAAYECAETDSMLGCHLSCE